MEIIVEEWKPIIDHPEIIDGYYISSYGRIKFNIDGIPYDPEYISSNGYVFGLFKLNQEASQRFMCIFKLFPIDELVGLLFITIPESLYNKNLMIVHDDGNLSNNHAISMHWEEYVEQWTDLKITMAGYTVIPGEYSISNFGRIKDHKRDIMIYPYIDGDYYKTRVRMISIKGNDNCSKNIKLHRALAMSFNIQGRIEDECDMINHIDGNGLNFRLKNLEWCDNRTNTKHASMLGLEQNPVGEYHPRAKFTDKQRECIYEIIITLKDITPGLLYVLIKERLPMVSKDDIKYAKNIIKKQYHIMFPKLINSKTNRPLRIKYSKDEIKAVRNIIFNIFDKYGITEVQTYENKYKKHSQG